MKNNLKNMQFYLTQLSFFLQ